MISIDSRFKLLFSIGVLFCLAVSIAFFIRGYKYENDYSTSSEIYAEKKYDFIFIEKFVDSKVEIEQIKELYSSRMADYKEDQGKLATTFQFMMALMVISLLMLFYRPKKLKIPIVGMEIPDTLVQIFVIMGTVFTFGTFSLLMMSTIDSRMTLEIMTDQIECAADHQVSHYYSNARVLLDQGFTDPWCTYYHDIFKHGIHSDTHKNTAGFFLFLFYAPFIGSVIGSSLTLSLHFLNHTKNVLSTLLIIIIFFMLSATSFGMVKWFDYSSYFFGMIWATSTIFIAFWWIYGKKKADDFEKKNNTLEST